MVRARLWVIVGFLMLPLLTLAQEGRQQIASLGDFRLDSGEVIRDCRIGYRTFGTLNADRSNVLLFPTWFGGGTDELEGFIGPGKLADTSRYYVVAVDALADGVSSSPSNSPTQPRMAFPKITIDDMVRSEHQLLVRVLHIGHVRAVLGASMGGMQAFQWIVAFPAFMDKAVPIVGSPRLAAYDLLEWQAKKDAICDDPAWHGGDYTRQPARRALYELGALLATTPEGYNRETRREDVAASIAKAQQTPGFDANDYIRQAEAMMALDVSAPFGGSMEKAAAAVKARCLVIVSTYDHVVTPGPARDFAKRIHAEVLEIPSDCGHLVFICEDPKVTAAVHAFLAE